MRSVELPYAKSLANRVMTLRAVRGESLPEPDAWWSDDMWAMRRVLEPSLRADGLKVAQAGPAGTAYRFGLAYWAAQPGAEVLLAADERLRQRPIQPLVDSLRALGAKLESSPEGWRIRGTRLSGGPVAVDARQSSQFASALLLISECGAAPIQLQLPKGVVSAPYVAMTEALVREKALTWPPERDWSSALVFLAAVGLTQEAVRLPGLRLASLQGDARCADWGRELGFVLRTDADGVLVAEPAADGGDAESTRGPWMVDFGNTPDLAMPAAVAAALRGRSGRATGLQTLNAKESPRLDATARLLADLGCAVRSGSDWLEWDAPLALDPSVKELDSLGDHRMAFCAALVSLRCPVRLAGADAVAKSFPDFWRQFGRAPRT